MGKINAGVQIPLERKYQVFINGYSIDVARELTPGVANRELNEPVYGSDDPITLNIVDNGTLSIEALEKRKNNVLLDNLCNLSPDTVAKAYNFNNFVSVAVWANRKDYDNGKYIGAEFYGNATIIPTGKSGAPNEFGGRTFSGMCNAPRKFDIDDVAIASEKVVITAGAGVITGTPYQIPDDDLYALYVVALKTSSDGTVVEESEILTVTAAMVESDKSVTIAADDLTEMELADVDHAFVVYLASGGGVYPSGSIKLEGLYKSTA
jgi:hypothetical protein